MEMNFVFKPNLLNSFGKKAFANTVCVQGPEENKGRKEEKVVTRD
jgi:hypothetical protein